MNAAQIKEGIEYAVNEAPRKGVNPEKLHKIPAWRVRVEKKGVERWAEKASGGFGGYRVDGIRCILFNSDGSERGYSGVYKPRDFLMPWSEYQERVDFQKEEEEAHEMNHAITVDRLQKAQRNTVARLLADYPSLIWLEGYRQSTPQDPWHIRKDGYNFELTPEGLDLLLDSIATKVYEVLSRNDD